MFLKKYRHCLDVTTLLQFSRICKKNWLTSDCKQHGKRDLKIRSSPWHAWKFVLYWFDRVICLLRVFRGMFISIKNNTQKYHHLHFKLFLKKANWIQPFLISFNSQTILKSKTKVINTKHGRTDLWTKEIPVHQPRGGVASSAQQLAAFEMGRSWNAVSVTVCLRS